MAPNSALPRLWELLWPVLITSTAPTQRSSSALLASTRLTAVEDALLVLLGRPATDVTRLTSPRREELSPLTSTTTLHQDRLLSLSALEDTLALLAAMALL
jgi:hypothetical protein